MENSESIRAGLSLIFIDVLNGLCSPEIETFQVKSAGFDQN